MRAAGGSLLLILLLIFIIIITGEARAVKLHLLGKHTGRTGPRSAELPYKTFYFEQQIDHFGFVENGSFLQRFLLSDYHWSDDGPVLFYTGNEGDITWFCNNTGFMWDVAEELGALLVFAEHRYYGESLPYGDQSYASARHLNFLSSSQALADFAALIQHLKRTRPRATHSPVIAVGGSYGGMLAAWLRMKYPNSVIGALAASAPIFQFWAACGDFYRLVTRDFSISGVNCSRSIRRSWTAINRLANTSEGRLWLSQQFRLCDALKKPEDVEVLKAWLQETWVNVAMVDYPYKADFLQPLPAWPVKAICSHLSFDAAVSDRQLLRGVAAAARVYYNYTGGVACLDTAHSATGSLGFLGWFYQSCTEMVMPMCSDGVSDMFEPQPWNFQAFSDECFAQFGVRPRRDWVELMYGGRDITAHSNIIFSNGNLDPWTSGGVTESLSDSLVAILIEGGAHHLDLRYYNEYDPSSVIQSRALEVRYIQRWIQQHRTARKPRL